MNPTEPVHQPLSVFFAVKDGKRSDFLKRYVRSFLRNYRKTVIFSGLGRFGPDIKNKSKKF